MANLTRKILEELIYERVRVTVDLYELMEFESDLTMSIERALQRCARSSDEKQSLTLRYLHRAWARVGNEVLRRRGQETGEGGAGDEKT